MRPPAPLHTSVCDVAQWGTFFVKNFSRMSKIGDFKKMP